MATVDEITAMARSIRERANDLRALEVLGCSADSPGAGGMPINGDDVESWNDTGTSRWDSWRADSSLGLDISGIDTSRFGAEFDYIPDMFESLAFGDQSDYDAVLAALDATSRVLCPDDVAYTVPDSVLSVQSLNDGWTGSFSNALRQRVAYKLQHLGAHQKAVAQELATAVKGHWNLVEGARESLLAIATGTEAALTNAIHDGGFGGSYMYDGGQDNQKITDSFLAITGAVLAIAGVIVNPPVGALAIATTTVAQANTANSLSKTFSGGIEVESGVTKKETPIEGVTANEIIAAMHDALTMLAVEIAGEEQAQADQLQSVIDSVNDQLELEAPALADESSFDPETMDDSFKLQPYRPALADEVPVPGSSEMNHAA